MATTQHRSKDRPLSRVVLISRDQELYEVCRAVCHSLEVAFVVEGAGWIRKPGEFAIWDLSSGHLGNANGTSGHQGPQFPGDPGDLYVALRKSIQDAQKLIPAAVFGLLLKPVRRAVLHSFLSAALNRPEKASGVANNEDLLQTLLEANVRLQECDQDRTNFLARVLHDFRTPLTTLQGYSDMLLRQNAGPLNEEQIDLLQRMAHSIARLAKMSKAMFELSTRHNTETKPNMVRTAIEDCIQNAVNTILPIAEEKEIDVTMDLDPPEVSLYADPTAIEQVLVNLLENACKFTPRGGSIDISGRFAESRIGISGELSRVYKVELKDTGMGIAPEHLDSVFEEFTSYAGARDRSGGGLGLAICKMLITAHKGSIWAESDNTGTKISFTLPVSHDVGTAETDAPAFAGVGA